jgi:hypothetical protein
MKWKLGHLRFCNQEHSDERRSANRARAELVSGIPEHTRRPSATGRSPPSDHPLGGVGRARAPYNQGSYGGTFHQYLANAALTLRKILPDFS